MFIGVWRCSTDDSTARFVVRKTKSGTLKVSGYDSSDDEKFVISNIRFYRGTLRFESKMRSTGQCAEHVFIYVSERCITHKLTVFETWISNEICEAAGSAQKMTVHDGERSGGAASKGAASVL